MNPERVQPNLSKPVQELVELIYDIDAMKQAMLDFNIDSRRMPLQRISNSRISLAFQVLKEISVLIGNYDVPHRFAEASNRFYDLIPPNQPAPIINSDEAVNTKCEMLKSLLEMKVAYNINDEFQHEVNRLDALYEELNCVIRSIPKDSNEFQVIAEYLKSSKFQIFPLKIEIEEIFKIHRLGEEQKFERLKHHGNCQFLWYGSRTTNFVGILKNGLKLTPDEGPIGSLRFGNGFYFSDMSSKALNDCGRNDIDDTCLMMLSEVILGKQLELTGRGKWVDLTKVDAPSIKAIGKIYPDPDKTIKDINGTFIPIGKVVVTKTTTTQFEHNEYIVRNPEQVKCRYLVRGKVKHDC